jgi:hypothetical protein
MSHPRGKGQTCAGLRIRPGLRSVRAGSQGARCLDYSPTYVALAVNLGNQEHKPKRLNRATLPGEPRPPKVALRTCFVSRQMELGKFPRLISCKGPVQL